MNFLEVLVIKKMRKVSSFFFFVQTLKGKTVIKNC